MFRPFCLVCLIGLAACSSRGGDDGEDPETRAELAERLNEELRELPESDPATLPTTGTAEYRGFMIADLPVDPSAPTDRLSYVGRLDMSVAFDNRADPLSGRASDFTDRFNVTLGGALELDSGSVDRGNDPDQNYTFDGTVRGSLSHPEAGPLDIDATMAGEFRGANQEGVNGVFFGDVRTDFGLEIFDGSFAAERIEPED